MGRLLISTIVGGIVVFAWGAVSWMVLPWHAATLQPFSNEVAVASVIRATVSHPGTYMLPNARSAFGKANPANAKAREKAAQERMRQGPSVLAAVRLEGTNPSSPWMYLKGLGVEMLGALGVTILLLLLPRLGYWERVKIVTMVALVAGLLCYVQDWHWWGFSTSYTLVKIADLVIGYGLAGLAMAKVLEAGQP